MKIKFGLVYTVKADLLNTMIIVIALHIIPNWELLTE